MAKYLLVQSRSPFESGDAQYVYTLVRELLDCGNEVTLYLVQNAVLAARRGAKDLGLGAVAQSIPVVADDFSLAERSISGDQLIPAVTVGSAGVVIDALVAGDKVVWH